MERLDDYNAYILGAIGAVTLFIFYILLKKDPEAPVPYNVTPPEQTKPGWKGEVLEEPSQKVRNFRMTIRNSSDCMIGVWLPSYPMLLSCDRRVSWPRKPLHLRRYRSCDRESKRRANTMVKNHILRAEKGAQDYAPVRQHKVRARASVVIELDSSSRIRKQLRASHVSTLVKRW